MKAFLDPLSRDNLHTRGLIWTICGRFVGDLN